MSAPTPYRLLILCLAPVLFACQSAPQPSQSVANQVISSQDYANLPAGVTPQNFHLPTDKGCKGDIARFKAVIDNDLGSGHTTDKVNQAIHAELNKISDICPAQDAAATQAVRALKSKYGYPNHD
jgi:hypothetical protein